MLNGYVLEMGTKGSPICQRSTIFINFNGQYDRTFVSVCRVLGTFETVRSILKPEKKIENFTIISTFLCRFGLNICPKRPSLVHQTQKIRVFVTHTRYFCTNMKFETNPLTKSETFRDFRTLFKQQQSRQ